MSQRLHNLAGVHPRLAACVEAALAVVPDVCVFEGVRTSARQAALLARGVSKTMRSRHLVQADGYGHAVDLVPLVDGRPNWSDDSLWRYDAIRDAMRRAAPSAGLTLTWGGDWRWKDYAHWQIRSLL